MKLIIKNIPVIFLLLIYAFPLSAKDGIYGEAGFKIIYSKDEEVAQHYYKPFGRFGWSGDYIDISASYYRSIDYSITDADFNTKKIDIDQPGADITVYAGDIVNISAGYSFFSGDSSYTAHLYTGELLLDFDSFDISVDSSVKNAEYEFNGTVKNSCITADGELSFDITDSLSWDIGYLYEYTDYKTYGYNYSKNSGRIGIVAVPVKTVYFISGITGGIDSDNVKSAAFDAGLTIKLFEHLKLSAAYMCTAEFITSGSSSLTGGRRGSSSSTTSTETDISHTGYISVSLYF